ncbi:MAG TPA: response regulator, partial [Kofleriaceae bacterium]|nr:response regulator [Kofleriaceae bacterium]
MATILLIDDDEDLRGLTADLLELHGHEVRTCSNGVEGLHALDEAFPQLVITDVEMPALDGPAMVQRMFVDNIGRENIPVVIVSGAEGVSKIAAA